MNGIPMNFDYSKTINEQLDTFNYYKDRYISYEFQILKLNQRERDLLKLREYIDAKIQKSFDYDFGRSDKRSDRLMTETVIELQLILEKIDSILK